MSHEITTTIINNNGACRHTCSCGWYSVSFYSDFRMDEARKEREEHERKYLKKRKPVESPKVAKFKKDAPRLDDVVRQSIYSYPTLYRQDNYEHSRLTVLNHLFLVIGNGYEWHPDGYLYYVMPNKQGRKTLPKNFFEMNLYTFDLPKKSKADLEKALKNKFYYFRKEHYGNLSVVFEAEKKEAQKLADIFAENQTGTKTAHYAGTKEHYEFLRKYGDVPDHFIIHPYPISEYSAISEIFNKRTNSLHIQNFDLVPQPDWLAGAIDIAVATLDFYEDEEKAKYNSYHPRKRMAITKREWEETKDKKNWNINPGESIEDYVYRHWNEYKEKQISFLTEFLKEFK